MVGGWWLGLLLQGQYSENNRVVYISKETAAMSRATDTGGGACTRLAHGMASELCALIGLYAFDLCPVF